MLTFTQGTLILVYEIVLLEFRSCWRLVVAHDEAGDGLAFIIDYKLNLVLGIYASDVI